MKLFFATLALASTVSAFLTPGTATGRSDLMALRSTQVGIQQQCKSQSRID